MKRNVKTYKEFLNESVESKDFITDFDEAANWLKDNWCYTSTFDFDKLKKNNDGTFDYDDSVSLYQPASSIYTKIKKLKVNFNRVNGSFYIQRNEIENLNGFPNYVNDDLYCHTNNIKSLEGSPSYVGGSCFF